jgi:hypothetical protein
VAERPHELVASRDANRRDALASGRGIPRSADVTGRDELPQPAATSATKAATRAILNTIFQIPPNAPG